MNRTLSVGLLTIILLFAVFYYFIQGLKDNNGYNETELILTLTGAVSAIIIFLFYNRSHNNYSSPMRIVYIFIIGYVIVFFQKYIDLVLGNCSKLDTYLFMSHTIINKTALLSLVGLVAFLLSYITTNNNFQLKSSYTSNIPIKPLNYLLGIAVLLFVFINGADYIIGSYNQEYLDNRQGSIGAYSEVLVRALIIVILTFDVHNSHNKKVNFLKYAKRLGFIFNFSLFLYIALVMLSGDRGPIIQVLIIYFAAYVLKYKPKIRLIYFIFLLFAGAILMSLLFTTRRQDKSLSFSERFVTAVREEGSYESESILPITEELANSVRCTHYAVSYVPNRHSHLYGSFQCRELTGAIPFSSVLTKHIYDSDIKYKSSAHFVTYINQGYFYTYGEGTTCIADLYLSWGVWGVLIGMFLFGFLVKKVELTTLCISNDQIPIPYIALALVLFGCALYIPRGTILGQLNYFVFSCIIIFLYKRIINKK